MHSDQVIFFVDDMNNDKTFGYTNNTSTVNYNLSLLSEHSEFRNFDKTVENSKNGLTTLFPIGRFIVILRTSKDKEKREMILLDFRADYSTIDKLADIFSDSITLNFKKIKYHWDEVFTDKLENFVVLAHSGN